MFNLALLAVFAAAEIVSTGIGQVQGKVVTSREVQMQNLLELALADTKGKDKYHLLGLDAKVFARKAQETLLYAAISLEADNFNVVQLTPQELETADKTISARLRVIPAWLDLQVSTTEQQNHLRQILLAKKFIQFRTQSSVLPVTDSEALRYFNENRVKYGDLTFANSKENIKAMLSRSQADGRLKEWYDSMITKYHVKNMISEL